MEEHFEEVALTIAFILTVAYFQAKKALQEAWDEEKEHLAEEVGLTEQIIKDFDSSSDLHKE